MNEYKRFISISLAWAWSFYVLNILTGAGVQSWWGQGLVMLGGISPAVAAGWLVYRRGPGAVGAFVRSLVDVRRIPRALFFFITLFPLLLLWGAIGGAAFFFPGRPAFVREDHFSSGLIPGVVFILTVFAFGPLPEEIGWRGVLLPALHRRYSLLRSALAVAVVWALWHVPLFFIAGYPLAEMRSHPWALLVYFAQLFPKSVVFAWLYIRTNKSVLACILFHFFINFYGMTWETGTVTQYLEFLLWTVIALYAVRNE
jgi:membrane protease YdiL (CAAX protease family)